MRKRIGAVALIACVAPIGAMAQTVGEVRIAEVSDTGDPAMIRRSMMTNASRDWQRIPDYPAAALAERRGGQVLLTVAIGADDRVAACLRPYVLEGSPDLGQAACAIARSHGRYLHSIDADGKPLPGEIQLQIGFRALDSATAAAPAPPPGPAPGPGWSDGNRAKPIDSAQLDLRGMPASARPPTAWLNISEKGKVTRCRIRASSGSDAGDAAACRQLSRARFTPAMDRSGKPVAQIGLFVEPKVVP